MTVTIRRVSVRGRVQGVGYRAFVEVEALRRSLQGWVRNRNDGTVEALFMGDEAAIVAMVDACRQGPFAARVDAIYEREGDNVDLGLRRPGELFSVLATA